jgi:hypothetical protein
MNMDYSLKVNKIGLEKKKEKKKEKKFFIETERF